MDDDYVYIRNRMAESGYELTPNQTASSIKALRKLQEHIRENPDLAEELSSLSENEILRLQLKQALINDNAKAAGSYAQALIASQVQQLQLAASNPFGLLNTDIKAATDSLLAMANALKALQVPPVITQLSGSAAFAAKVAAVPTYEAYASPWQFGGASADPVYRVTQGNQTITIVDATSGGVNAITQNNSLNGTPATVSRYNAIGGL